MKRAVRTPPRAVLATALLLSWSLFALSPDACAAPPGKGGSRERGVVRLEEMVIRGEADYPGVLYLLPRPEPPLLPFTAGPEERRESILRDTRDGDDASLPGGSR